MKVRRARQLRHGAKQLRKGAFPRLSEEDFATLHSAKAERLALEKITRGLVHYDVPAWTGVEAEPLIMLPPNRRPRR
jgi:hypothetical protein